MPDDKTEANKIWKQFYGNPQGLADYLVQISLTETGVVHEVFKILDAYSTLDVGCRFINKANYFQLVKKNRGYQLCADLYRWLTTINAPLLKPASCAGNAGTLIFLKSAIDTAKPEKEEEKSSGFYTVDAGIILESEAIAVLEKIGPLYFRKVGKKFNVNSGTRDAYRQADAMWIKYPKDKTFSEYPQRKLIGEILEAIKNAQAAGKTREGIVQAMANAIQIQINRKEYISKHLIAGCIDIATQGDSATKVPAMSSAEQKIMIQIAIQVTSGSAIKENNPPHIHIQFK